MPATFNIPTAEVIPGQLIAASLWNAEFANLYENLTPAGVDDYSASTGQMQSQVDPYPSSVLSQPTSMAGELARARYVLAGIKGTTYWYQPPAKTIAELNTFNLTHTHSGGADGAAAVGVIPIGGVIDYPSATPPSANFLLANGAAINRTTYATLFSLIGTTFGVGDNSTTFNLPNYTDRMSIAAGNLYALAATGGAPTHTLTTAEIPAVTVTDPGHIHTQTQLHTHALLGGNAGQAQSVQLGDPNANALSALASSTGGGQYTAYAPQNGSFYVQPPPVSDTINSRTTGITVAGGGGAHSILNPYLAMYKMMRVL